MRRVLVLATSMVAAALLVAAPAAAHVTANPDTVEPDAYNAVGLRIGHGCGDSGTVEVAVQIPEEFQSVTPEQLPGWTVTTETGELDEPYEDHGETVTEGVVEVVWTADDGQPLPADEYRDFGLSVRTSDAAQGTIYLPTIQTCEQGEHAWVEVPADDESWGDLDEPAPYVEVVSAGGEQPEADPTDTPAVSDDEDPAPDGEVAADDDAGVDDTDEDGELAADATTEGDTSLVAWIALALGALGVVVGGAGFAAGRR